MTLLGARAFYVLMTYALTSPGSMDDDELIVGSSTTWPWTAHVLGEAPDLKAIMSVCNIVGEAPAREF